MKNSLLAFFLLFTTVIAFAQADSSDRAKLLGTWGIYEMEKGGKTVMSFNPAINQQLIDDTWAEDSLNLKKMGLDKAFLVKSVEQQSEILSKTTFTFNEKGKAIVSANDDKSKDASLTYTVNEGKKEITIKEAEGNKKLTYTYMIVDDLLILKEENERLLFKRKF